MPLSDEISLERRDATLSLAQANVFSVIIMAAVVLVTVSPYVMLWGLEPLIAALEQTARAWIVLPPLIGGILAHEALHALVWKALGRISWSQIEFGVKMLTPYTHCTARLPLSAYRWGTALPGLALGIVPAFAGLTGGDGRLLIWGAIFTAAASGDGLVLWLLRDAPPEAQVLDHPSEVGCQLLIPQGGESDGTT